jgi:hypothetical protein
MNEYSYCAESWNFFSVALVYKTMPIYHMLLFCFLKSPLWHLVYLADEIDLWSINYFLWSWWKKQFVWYVCVAEKYKPTNAHQERIILNKNQTISFHSFFIYLHFWISVLPFILFLKYYIFLIDIVYFLYFYFNQDT